MYLHTYNKYIIIIIICNILILNECTCIHNCIDSRVYNCIQTCIYNSNYIYMCSRICNYTCSMHIDFSLLHMQLYMQLHIYSAVYVCSCAYSCIYLCILRLLEVVHTANIYGIKSSIAQRPWITPCTTSLHNPFRQLLGGHLVYNSKDGGFH